MKEIKPYYFVQVSYPNSTEITRFEVNHKGLEQAITFADKVGRHVLKLKNPFCGVGVEIIWQHPTYVGMFEDYSVAMEEDKKMRACNEFGSVV